MILSIPPWHCVSEYSTTGHSSCPPLSSRWGWTPSRGLHQARSRSHHQDHSLWWSWRGKPRPLTWWRTQQRSPEEHWRLGTQFCISYTGYRNNAKFLLYTLTYQQGCVHTSQVNLPHSRGPGRTWAPTWHPAGPCQWTWRWSWACQWPRDLK